MYSPSRVYHWKVVFSLRSFIIIIIFVTIYAFQLIVKWILYQQSVFLKYIPHKCYLCKIQGGKCTNGPNGILQLSHNILHFHVDTLMLWHIHNFSEPFHFKFSVSNHAIFSWTAHTYCGICLHIILGVGLWMNRSKYMGAIVPAKQSVEP